MVRVGVRIRFSVWLVSGYAHVLHHFPLSLSLTRNIAVAQPAVSVADPEQKKNKFSFVR